MQSVMTLSFLTNPEQNQGLQQQRVGRRLLNRARDFMQHEFAPSNSPTKGGTADQIKEFPVTPEEAAKFLKVTRATAMTMARTGRIPAHPLESGKRKRWLFFLSELEAHVRGLAVNSSGHPLANQ
jgi:excisionase family DNA binding protein